MINKLMSIVRRNEAATKMSMCMSRASAGIGLLNIDSRNPVTWEFSGFSQNGEDGIVEYLSSQITTERNKYFLEIGSANGIENNSAWLAFGRKWNGLMIEGSQKNHEYCEKYVAPYNIGVVPLNMFVGKDTIPDLKKITQFLDPDYGSVDIDGNDYYVVKELLDAGFKPKIFSVEYNSAFGPDKSITIQYDANFNFREAHSSNLYYGVSITAWRNLFEKYGYHFVTVDTKGVNAFFISKDDFEENFISSIKSVNFKENFYQLRKFGFDWKDQFELINKKQFFVVE